MSKVKVKMSQLSDWMKKFSFHKPDRRLGGGYIADRVVQRHPINLCPSCVKRYGDWYSPVNYMPDWDYSPACGKPGWTTDCDGCGDHLAEGCTGFYPAETAFEVMAKDLHFTKANPYKRILFSRF